MSCTDIYTEVTAKCLSKRVVYHPSRDMKSDIVRHCLNANHETVSIRNFQMEYNNNTYRKRISEALFAK